MHSTQCSRWKLKHNKKYYETVLPALCGERRCECHIPVGTHERNEQMSHIQMRKRNSMNQFKVMFLSSFGRESMKKADFSQIKSTSGFHCDFFLNIFVECLGILQMLSLFIVIHRRQTTCSQRTHSFCIWRLCFTRKCVYEWFLLCVAVLCNVNKIISITLVHKWQMHTTFDKSATCSFQKTKLDLDEQHNL